MSLRAWLSDHRPYVVFARDTREALETACELGERRGRELGYLEGYSARLRQEEEARTRATSSILRVIQGGDQ